LFKRFQSTRINHTLRLHYNAVLYNSDTIITRSPRCSQIFFQYTMHIYFPYSTVTSASQGSGLACTRTIAIFRALTYMQKHFRH